MRVLIACEESQRVCIEFRRLGHEAYSCDIQECSGGHPEWHIHDDVLKHLDECWDLIIAHPPCTYLSNAGACRLYKRIDNISYIETNRFLKAISAKHFFMRIYAANCKQIAIENPVPSVVYDLPPYTQIIEPYFFGDPWKKKTCLWLKNLSPLVPTHIVEPTGLWVSGGSKNKDGSFRKNIGKQNNAKIRSKTFPGIAKAMAEQWGGKA